MQHQRHNDAAAESKQEDRAARGTGGVTGGGKAGPGAVPGALEVKSEESEIHHYAEAVS